MEMDITLTQGDASGIGGVREESEESEEYESEIEEHERFELGRFRISNRDIHQLGRFNRAGTMHVFACSAKLLQNAIRRGGNVNQRGALGKTPLMYAVRKRFIRPIKFLVKHGADIHLLDELGRGVWDHAIETFQTDSSRSTRVVTLLISLGAMPPITLSQIPEPVLKRLWHLRMLIALCEPLAGLRFKGAVWLPRDCIIRLSKFI